MCFFGYVYVRDTFRASHLLAAKRREYESTKIFDFTAAAAAATTTVDAAAVSTVTVLQHGKYTKKLVLLFRLPITSIHVEARNTHSHDAPQLKCLREFLAYTHSERFHMG